MKSFRIKTNRQRKTKRRDINWHMWRHNRNYTDRITPTPKHCPRHFFLILPQLNIIFHSNVYYLIKNLWLPPPQSCQHNHNKYPPTPPCQKWYNSKSHNLPDKRGRIFVVNPLSNHQQALKESQYRKNVKSTPTSDFSNSSIAADILWPLLLKNRLFFINKNPLLQIILVNPFVVLDSTRVLQRAHPTHSKLWHSSVIIFWYNKNLRKFL